MDEFKSANLAVRFLLEICVLISVGYWGFTTRLGWFLTTLLGIGTPLLIAIIWGMFGSPKAPYLLNGLMLLALEAVVFSSGVAALYATKNYSLALGLAVIIIINRILMFVWQQ